MAYWSTLHRILREIFSLLNPQFYVQRHSWLSFLAKETRLRCTCHCVCKKIKLLASLVGDGENLKYVLFEVKFVNFESNSLLLGQYHIVFEAKSSVSWTIKIYSSFEVHIMVYFWGNSCLFLKCPSFIGPYYILF